MKGALPPSSKDKRFIVFAAILYRILPTSVEPVNDNFRSLKSSQKALPIISELPVITLNTPADKPASLANFASTKADRGGKT